MRRRIGKLKRRRRIGKKKFQYSLLYLIVEFLDFGPCSNISIQLEDVHRLEIALFISGSKEIVCAKCPSMHIVPLK